MCIQMSLGCPLEKDISSFSLLFLPTKIWKSLLKLLSIGIKNGSEVTVHAEGPDADEAVEVLGELLATIRD